MVEYYAYSIYHGQAAALGGRDRTHGLAVGAFKQSCTNDSHNEPRTVVWMCDCRTAVGLSDLSDLSDPHLTVSDSTRTCDRSELLSDTVGLLSDTVGPVGLSDCRTCRTVGLLSEVTVGLSDQGSTLSTSIRMTIMGLSLSVAGRASHSRSVLLT